MRNVFARFWFLLLAMCLEEPRINKNCHILIQATGEGAASESKDTIWRLEPWINPQNTGKFIRRRNLNKSNKERQLGDYNSSSRSSKKATTLSSKSSKKSTKKSKSQKKPPDRSPKASKKSKFLSFSSPSSYFQQPSQHLGCAPQKGKVEAQTIFQISLNKDFVVRLIEID